MTFSYQKTRHQRTQTPKEYASYKTYKPYLRKEFAARCVYCRMPDSLKGADQFGADHYRPQKIFPQLASHYGNLFYCCNRCNSRKGEYWPANGDVDPKFIPNPCDHLMWDHLRYRQAEVEARTPAGLFSLDLLDLNDPELIAYRADVLHLIEINEKAIAEASTIKTEIRRLWKAGKIPEVEYTAAIGELDEQLAKSSSSLARLTGSVTS